MARSQLFERSNAGLNRLRQPICQIGGLLRHLQARFNNDALDGHWQAWLSNVDIRRTQRVLLNEFPARLDLITH